MSVIIKERTWHNVTEEEEQDFVEHLAKLRMTDAQKEDRRKCNEIRN